MFVCVFVCCGTLKKREITRVSIQKRSRVYIQNVSVYAGTTRTCVSTCARGAGTHQDVLNVHTGSKGWIIGSSAYQNLPTYGITCFRGSPKKPMDLTHFQLKNRSREQHVADSSNHSLCLIKLFSFSNPEGHCGRNQL